MNDLAAFATLFLHRRDTFCLQGDDGRYQRMYRRLTDDLLCDHLAGRVTLAGDAADRQGFSRWCCVDADRPDGLTPLARVQAALGDLNLVTVREASRRGGHLWLLCAAPMPAALLRRVVLGVLARLGLALEVYPDHDVPVGTRGITHPVRLPLGVHRVVGRRYPFLDADDRPCHAPDVAAALAWLVGQPRNTANWLHAALRQVAAPVVGERASGPRRVASGMIGWANRDADLLAIVASTHPATALRPAGQGFLGWCPWHPDEAPQADGSPGTPSLYVVRNARYGWSWRCLSTNCGAHDPARMAHGFDWFVWCAAGDLARAVVLTEEWKDRYG